jgi:hypothetical protein
LKVNLTFIPIGLITNIVILIIHWNYRSLTFHGVRSKMPSLTVFKNSYTKIMKVISTQRSIQRLTWHVIRYIEEPSITFSFSMDLSKSVATVGHRRMTRFTGTSLPVKSVATVGHRRMTRFTGTSLTLLLLHL